MFYLLLAAGMLILGVFLISVGTVNYSKKPILLGAACLAFFVYDLTQAFGVK